MGRVPGQPALKRALAGLIVLFVGLVLLWWRWPHEAQPVQAQPAAKIVHPHKPAPRRARAASAEPAPPPDDASLLEAAQGEFGLALRNRVCGLCVSGTLDDREVCKFCGDVAVAGRVNIDLVGDDGRPIPQFDGWVNADCQKSMGFGNSGHLDLPEGPCTLRPYRFDGALLVRGPPVEVGVTRDEELYQLLEVPAGPHGGVGLTLNKQPEGFVVEGLIAATAAQELGGLEGMYLTGIDGSEVGLDLELADVLELLVGPEGTEIEITLTDQDGKTHTHVLDRRKILGPQLHNLHGQPG